MPRSGWTVNPWRSREGHKVEPWVSQGERGFFIVLAGRFWSGPGRWYGTPRFFSTRTDAEAQITRLKPNPAWLQRRLAPLNAEIREQKMAQDKADILKWWPDFKLIHVVGAVTGESFFRVSVDGEDPLGVGQSEEEVLAKFAGIAREHLRSHPGGPSASGWRQEIQFAVGSHKEES